MPEHAPVLPAHKLRFVRRRMLQTISGGIRFNAPVWVILLQLCLFLLPIVTFVAVEQFHLHPISNETFALTISQSQPFSLWLTFSSFSSPLMYGGFFCFEYLTGRFLNRIGENDVKASRIRPAPSGDAKLMLKEEGEVALKSTRQILRFVFERREWLVVSVEVVISFTFGFAAFLGLSLQEVEATTKALDLVAVASAAYALCIRQPTEIWQRGEANVAANRAVIVLLLCVSQVVCVVLNPTLTSHMPLVVLAVSPLLWSLGVYPSVVTLVEWALEQVAMLVFGCTVSPTLPRLIEHLLLSVIGWMLLHLLFAMDQPILACSSSFLWILLIASGFAPGTRMNNSCLAMVKTSKDLALHVLKVGSIPAVVVLGYSFAEQSYWAVAAVGLTTAFRVFSLLYAQVEMPFIFSIALNKPRVNMNVDGTRVKWKRLIRWMNSLLQLAWITRTVTIGLSQERWSLEVITSSAIMVGGARRAFVSPDLQAASLLLTELWFGLVDRSHAVLTFFLIYTSTDRIARFVSKSHFVYLLLVSSSSLLQYKATYAMVLAFDLLVAAACALLDAPMLPILGTPMTFVGFPRPKRLWYAPREERGCIEGAYYNQVLEQIQSLVAESLVDARSGTVYMLRIGQMVAYVLITEVGLDYAVVEIKGLELQDRTSCHHVEAGFIDRVVSRIQDGGTAVRIPPSCIDPLAPIKLSTVPLCRREFRCYEESKIRLTGVIENEAFHKVLKSAFLCTLTFALTKIPEATLRSSVVNEWDLTISEDDEFPNDWLAYLLGKCSGPCGPIGPPGDEFNDTTALETEMDELLGDMDSDSLWHLERGEASSVPSNPIESSATLDVAGSSMKRSVRVIDSTSPKEDIAKAVVLFIEQTVNCSGFPLSDVATWGGRHVCDCFSGVFPQSSELRRLKAAPVLHDLAVDAYRTALKLALDAHTCFDPDPSFADHEHVERCLKEYSNSWHIGLPASKDWAAEVNKGCKNLLALRKPLGKAEELLQLSFGKQEGWLFQVREEVVQAIWANLAVELYYFTCDDDERFSIQASGTLLRNLHIQAADTPLGYPVFQTTFISVQAT